MPWVRAHYRRSPGEGPEDGIGSILLAALVLIVVLCVVVSIVVSFVKAHWVIIVAGLALCAALTGAYFWIDYYIEKKRQDAAKAEAARIKRIKERRAAEAAKIEKEKQEAAKAEAERLQQVQAEKAAEAIKLARFAAVRMMESAPGSIRITHKQVTVELDDWVLNGPEIDAAAQAIEDALLWYQAMKPRTAPDMMLIEIISEGVSVTVNGPDWISLPTGDYPSSDFDRLRALGDELAQIGASRNAAMNEARRVALLDPRESRQQERPTSKTSPANMQKRLPNASVA